MSRTRRNRMAPVVSGVPGHRSVQRGGASRTGVLAALLIALCHGVAAQSRRGGQHLRVADGGNGVEKVCLRQRPLIVAATR